MFALKLLSLLSWLPRFNHRPLMHLTSASLRCIKCISTSRCITVHHGASPGRCCGASKCIIVHHGMQNVPSWCWHVSCVLCSFSTTAASYEPTLGVWAGVSTQIQNRSADHIKKRIFLMISVSIATMLMRLRTHIFVHHGASQAYYASEKCLCIIMHHPCIIRCITGCIKRVPLGASKADG